MRLPHRPPGLWTSIAALLLGLYTGCSGSGRAGSGQSLAEATAAEREYRSLRARFFAASAAERAGLEPDIRRFVAAYPGDARALSASVFLAFALTDRDRLDDARALLAELAAKGYSSDYATVAQAALFTRAGAPERALALLEPLVGKIVDQDERLVHGEELLRAALAAGHHERAVQAMLEWLVQAPLDRHDAVRRDIRALLSGVPSDDSLRALQQLSRALKQANSSKELSSGRRWLHKALFVELSRRSLEASDGALSRVLLPLAPASVRASTDYAALARQAAQGTTAARIAGRAVGLFLSVGSEEARRRSAALASGLSRALESSSPRVELLVRDNAGSNERSTAALAALASDGAAILIAGADDESAQIATLFAERARIPLLLARSVPSEEQRRYSFVLGVDEAQSLRVLEEGLAARGRRQLARVGGGGTPCSAPAAFAGKPRFPLDTWQKQNVDAVVVLGSPSCARDVVRELAGQRQPPLVACGLECASAVLGRGGPALGLRAGRFPAGDGGWYEALGRDAAALVQAALADFPHERVVDQAQVGELHARARSALERVEITLETSEQRGFGGRHVLPRALAVVDGEAAPGLKSSGHP